MRANRIIFAAPSIQKNVNAKFQFHGQVLMMVAQDLNLQAVFDLKQLPAEVRAKPVTAAP